MDVTSVESGFALSRMIVGGLLASAAVSVAFGPELVRTLVRLRVDRGRESDATPSPAATSTPS